MRSMTGCGSGTVRRDGWEVTVELKTVNHRFLDVGIRLPRNLAFLEQGLRDRINEQVRRGHVDVFVTVNSLDSLSSEVQCDADLAMLYYNAANLIAERTGTVNDVTVSSLMAQQGVLSLSEREMDADTVLAICSEAAGTAAEQVRLMREREGEHLREDLQIHLNAVAGIRNKILERAPLVVGEFRNKLEQRMKKLLADNVEPQRLAQEVALIADRCAIDEELARLDSHIRQMRVYLDTEGEIGKKMDFLIQEMNREANTIGSKASDAEIAQHVVDLKSEIEKLREQIQNVE